MDVEHDDGLAISGEGAHGALELGVGAFEFVEAGAAFLLVWFDFEGEAGAEGVGEDGDRLAAAVLEVEVLEVGNDFF